MASGSASQIGGISGKINRQSMQNKLKELEMKYSIDWRDYDLAGDEGLFTVETGSLLSANELRKGKIPRISAKSDNNGIAGWYSSENLSNARHYENFISVNFFGTDGGIFYHPYKASVEMKVHVLKPQNFELNDKTGVYFATALRPVLFGFSYGNQLSSSKLKTQGFKLKIPMVGNEIAFDYIEEFVNTLEAERLATLEAERLATLEAYLEATGLKDVEISAAEAESLRSLGTTGGTRIEWREFRFSELFSNIQQGARLTKADQRKGNIPYVMSGVTDTGVVGYISNPVREFPKNSLTIDIFGNTFYRDYAFGAGDDTGVFWNSDDRFDKFQMLFLASVINKFLAGKYDYGHKLRASRTLDFEILLPVSADNVPDFDFMTTVMKATQKIVFKNVVEWLDKRIEATKAVING